MSNISLYRTANSNKYKYDSRNSIEFHISRNKTTERSQLEIDPFVDKSNLIDFILKRNSKKIKLHNQRKVDS